MNVGFACGSFRGFDCGFRLNVDSCCGVGFHVALGVDVIPNAGFDVDFDYGSD